MTGHGLLAMLLVSAPGPAEDPCANPAGIQWEFSETIDGVIMRTRSVPGTDVRQVYAEKTADGTVGEYRKVVTDVESFPKFQTYVKEGRVLKKEPGGIEYTYLRLELPWPLSPRDYVTKRVVETEPYAAGNGEFRSHWSAADGLVPPKPGIVRVPRNDGCWHISTLEPGKVRIQHGFVVDPGGAIPTFAVNYANKKAVPDMLKAFEAEVRRRRSDRPAPRPGDHPEPRPSDRPEPRP
jgi:polyketide cyclase/dehydrase/lipid transport protein